jgi:hypothetical protein
MAKPSILQSLGSPARRLSRLWLIDDGCETQGGEMREGGLEPPRLSAPDPKSGASANSATLAGIEPTPCRVERSRHSTQVTTAVCKPAIRRVKWGRQPDAEFLWFLPHRGNSPGCFSSALPLIARCRTPSASAVARGEFDRQGSAKPQLDAACL